MLSVDNRVAYIDDRVKVVDNRVKAVGPLMTRLRRSLIMVRNTSSIDLDG